MPTFSRNIVTNKLRARITFVDPAKRRIEGQIKDGAIVTIISWNNPIAWRWPKQEEVWTIYQEGGYWVLGDPVNPLDPDEVFSIDELNVDELKLDGTKVYNKLGKELATLEYVDDAVVGAATPGHTIKDEGVTLATRANLNFVGAGVTVTDSAGTNSSIVTVPFPTAGSGLTASGTTLHAGAGNGINVNADDIEVDFGLIAGTAVEGDDFTNHVNATTTVHGIADTSALVTLTGTQTLTNKTLTTPTIGSFTNATHSHQTAAGGGQLDHGLALTGLGDDDHTQYHTDARATTWLNTKIGVTVQAWDADLDTWATKTAPSGTVVGTTDTQTLTNKKLEDNTTTIIDETDNTKVAKFQASAIATGTTRTFDFPNNSGTLALVSDIIAGGISASIADAKGDLIVGTANDVVARQAVGTNGKVLTADSSQTTGVIWEMPIPVGAILPYGGSAAPTGWFICDGTAVSRTTYSVLFGILSTTFGIGDGSTTFNLPDLRDRTAVGVSGTIARAATGGAKTHALSTGELASHSHNPGTLKTNWQHENAGEGDSNYTHAHGGSGADFLKLATGGTIAGGAAFSVAAMTSTSTVDTNHRHLVNSGSTATEGSGTAHNNMQPYIGLYHIIRAI